ncbi:hypothetical protein [Anabaena sp. CA = ATCC 33047]|uniref:hypothetical protein n=1 Tax=Anabaena sp. (strain CA / ATCC 33047) TaxID=52271 RepID=UPI0008312560|nr:hypothetical protein [Anabaena sp. CA = ATCC 33047]
MFSQTIASDLLVELSTDEQQLLAGGKCGCNKSGSVQPPDDGTEPEAVAPAKARLAVGKIITVTPFAKCLNGEETDGGMEDMM